MKDFNGKSVVVTGAGSGIGKETALAFARRGARLSIIDKKEGRLEEVRKQIEEMGNTVKSYTIDVSQGEQVKDLCDEIYREMGRVDVLFNNAGVGVAGLLDEITLEDWESVVGTNLWGIIYACHYFYPRMIEQGGGGQIVNTSSGGGLAPLPLLVPYCTTKFGVMGFCEALRPEAARHGIGVTAICPGIVRTNMITDTPIRSGSKKSTPQELLEKMAKLYTFRNYTPDKAAAVVVKAVEKNKGVAPVGPETYLTDWTHRLSRKLVDLTMKQLLDFVLKRM